MNRWVLLTYIVGLCLCLSARGLNRIEPPPASLENIHRGQMWYLTLRCFECHGIRGEGDGSNSASLRDDSGHPIKPNNFKMGKFKKGSRPEEIYRTIAQGIPGTPMAAYDRNALLIDRESQSFKDAPSGKIRYPLLEAMGALSSPKEQEELRKFVDRLPAHEELEKMGESGKEKEAAKRRWQLVHYILSLSKGVARKEHSRATGN